jgi:hypothetical protein
MYGFSGLFYSCCHEQTTCLYRYHLHCLYIHGLLYQIPLETFSTALSPLPKELYNVIHLYIKYNNLNILIKTTYNIVNLYLIDSHMELNIHSRLRTQMSVLWSGISRRRYRNIVCSAPTAERQFLVPVRMDMCINSNDMKVHKSITPRHVPNHDSVLKFLGWYVENPT